MKMKKYWNASVLKFVQGILTAGFFLAILVPTVAETAPISSPKVIGFFQTFDNECPPVWYFNNGESLKDSGYTVLIDAFWVNYPFCWGDGSGQPGKGSPIPSCKGIKNAPGPGLSNRIDQDFWTDYAGQAAPFMQGEAYNNYWTSLHSSGPQTVSKLREQIAADGNKVKLLASIGGWNMGGSSAGKQVTPEAPAKPAWAALLSSPLKFAEAMSAMMKIKVNNIPLYDGIDIDIETRYGEGCSAGSCTQQDEQQAINDMVTAIVEFKKNNPSAVLSISPRASDLVCEQQYCSWNSADGIGFVGKILQKLSSQEIYFDDINPQFYNDDLERNIPNSIVGDDIKYGNQVVPMLKKIHELGIIGTNTSLNIGVLAQTNSGEVDAGGASVQGNPGIPKRLIYNLWNHLQTDPAITATGIKINGLMGWASNLALSNTGVGGNVRAADSPIAHVVPYNWGSDID